MSDRAENPELIVCDGIDHLHCGREASPADALAFVRRGVESGTIEGRVVRECEHGLLHEVDQDTEGWDLRCPFNESTEPCRMSVTLVIPVDGEET